MRSSPDTELLFLLDCFRLKFNFNKTCVTLEGANSIPIIIPELLYRTTYNGLHNITQYLALQVSLVLGLSTGTAEDAQQTERRKGSFASAKPVPEQADSPGLGNDADANDFYLRHCGSPVTAGQKGKAPIQHVGESKPKWWPDNDEDDEDLCQIMEDLSGAGIRSRFDDQKVMLPDST